ncbi:MAG TPA: DUF6062 family protein [Capillibacterium sp.]
MKAGDPVIYNLAEALSEGACPVCRCLAAATGRSLRNFLYEFVNDPSTRDRLRACGGFCREHARALQQLGDPLAHSIIYADLIDGLCAGLTEQAAARNGHPAVPEEKEAACPVCREEKETQKRYLDGLLAAVRQSAFREEYRKQGFLCRPHFTAAYNLARDSETRSFLTAVQVERLSQLSGELKEFIRKSDYRFAGELPGSERDAWLRAVRFWTGGYDPKAK